MTPQPNRETVRQFITAIAARAKAALNGKEKPGYLQMSRLHPTSEDLVPSRYKLDDVERMIADAVAAAEAGHNVYIEGRTVSETVRGKLRGKLKDTAGVFALVIDNDADKGMGWKPNGSSPSMKVETSPGNSQDWIFLRDAVAADVGQKLGERIRKATGCDYDTGTITQPYRVAGTINYPNEKKQARGRIIVPTQLINLNTEALWTPEDIEREFPVSESPTGGGSGNGAGNVDEASIPAEALRVIREGSSASADTRDRSHTFWNVMMVLKRLGFTIDGIVNLLERYPDGIANKYEGRLRQEVERVYNKLDPPPPPPPPPPKPAQRLPPPSQPMAVARLFIKLHCLHEQVPTLRRWSGSWWTWRTTHWSEVEEYTVRSRLYHFTENAVYYHPKHGLVPWAPTRRKIGDLLEALAAIIILPQDFVQPCWLDDRASGPIVAVKNGLLDINTRELHAHSPLYFCTVSVPFAYDAHAPEPRRWLDFLGELWPQEPQAIDALGEWYGYVISGRTNLQKMLFHIGPTRGGKGVIAPHRDTSDWQAQCLWADVVPVRWRLWT